VRVAWISGYRGINVWIVLLWVVTSLVLKVITEVSEGLHSVHGGEKFLRNVVNDKTTRCQIPEEHDRHIDERHDALYCGASQAVSRTNLVPSSRLPLKFPTLRASCYTKWTVTVPGYRANTCLSQLEGIYWEPFVARSNRANGGEFDIIRTCTGICM
jgi:hypothetical protein